MNSKAMVWAVKQDLITRDKFVLIIVASYEDLEGRFATIRGLVERTGYSKSTVIAALASLEKIGSILVKKGIGCPNIYIINKKG